MEVQVVSSAGLVSDQQANKLFIDVLVFSRPLRLQVDTGAAVSLLNAQTYADLGSPPLSPVDKLLRGYGKHHIPLLGQFVADVTYKAVTRPITFIVVHDLGTANLFGLDAFQSFGFSVAESIQLVSDDVPYQSLESLCSSFQDVFAEGLGCATDFQAHLTLKPSARPRFFRARQIPLALRTPVKAELDRLTSLGVVVPVSSSEWGTPLVIVRKPSGALRLCGDFKATVNSQIVVDTYPLPRPDELFTQVAGGQFFSKLDLAEAYHQLPLDEESKNLMVLNTPFGLFQYQRLMFGVASAPAIFQRYLEQVTSRIPYCFNYLDDIVVTGRTTGEHLQNLRALLEKLRAVGLRCNLKKSTFFQPSLEYLGHVISRQGVRPMDSLVKAITDLPRPSSVRELQAFLGKVAYYHRFIPGASTIARPLYRLLRKGASFVWSAACERAFIMLKERLRSAPCLATFDPNKPLILATDASQYGVGAVLAHRNEDGSEQPLAFASKTLTPAQVQYSQVEKEALAIVYAVTKFHVFLYGHKFQLITDHKPLISLFSPAARIPDKAAHRLQRWALFLSKYHYDIHFRPTGQHANADALSRLPVGPDPEFDREEVVCFQLDVEVRQAVDGFPITSTRVAKATAADPTLREVVRRVQQGWSERPPGRASDPVRNYFMLRHRLSVVDGILLLATDEAAPRVVIPGSLRQEVLRLLHEGHWGVSRTKALARKHVYWPGIDRELEHLVAACPQCSSHQASPKSSFAPWPRATQPWERIHVDFAGPFLNAFWLIVLDSFSHFPYVVRCSSATSEVTIQALSKIFSVEGLPVTLVSDNGPQFRSQEFHNFCIRSGIRHVCSPPFHPQSNGEAERMVRTFKTQMRKYLQSSHAEESLNLFLMAFRTTPIGLHSPAELLHGRQPRTILHLLRPGPRPPSRIVNQGFLPGTPVWARGFGHRPRWIPAVIVRQHGRRVYTLRMGDREVRRHRNQLRVRISTQSPDPPGTTQPQGLQEWSSIAPPSAQSTFTSRSTPVSGGHLAPQRALVLLRSSPPEPIQQPCPVAASPSLPDLPMDEPERELGPPDTPDVLMGLDGDCSSPVLSSRAQKGVPRSTHHPGEVQQPTTPLGVPGTQDEGNMSPVLASRASQGVPRRARRTGQFCPYPRAPANRELLAPHDPARSMEVDTIAKGRPRSPHLDSLSSFPPQEGRSVVIRVPGYRGKHKLSGAPQRVTAVTTRGLQTTGGTAGRSSGQRHN